MSDLRDDLVGEDTEIKPEGSIMSVRYLGITIWSRLGGSEVVAKSICCGSAQIVDPSFPSSLRCSGCHRVKPHYPTAVGQLE